MPNYRRAYVPGGTFFFTLVTDRRAPILCDVPGRSLLGRSLRRCQMRWPMVVNSIVLTPDHLHTIWTLQPGDADYSRYWSWIKKEFTKEWLSLGGTEQAVTVGRRQERRRGVWQPRFWEHTIRDADDFERHFDYIHYNPVKHRLARCPHAWPWSSFHHWVGAGVYPDEWACSCRHPTVPLDFRDIEDTTGEPK
jgi:putative transposase